MSPQRRRRHAGQTNNYLVGDAFGFTDTGELLAAGADAAGDGAVDAGDDCCAGLAAGCVPGCAPVEPAGRKPRLLGLFNMLLARLLVIFASFIAVSNNAALRI